MEDQLPRYHSIPEIALLTGLSTSMLREYVYSGQLKALRNPVRNARIKVTLEDVYGLFERLSTPRVAS